MEFKLNSETIRELSKQLSPLFISVLFKNYGDSKQFTKKALTADLPRLNSLVNRIYYDYVSENRNVDIDDDDTLCTNVMEMFPEIKKWISSDGDLEVEMQESGHIACKFMINELVTFVKHEYRKHVKKVIESLPFSEKGLKNLVDDYSDDSI
jgi:hypothetical protein